MGEADEGEDQSKIGEEPGEEGQEDEQEDKNPKKKEPETSKFYERKGDTIIRRKKI